MEDGPAFTTVIKLQLHQFIEIQPIETPIHQHPQNGQPEKIRSLLHLTNQHQWSEDGPVYTTVIQPHQYTQPDQLILHHKELQATPGMIHIKDQFWEVIAETGLQLLRVMILHSKDQLWELIAGPGLQLEHHPIDLKRRILTSNLLFEARLIELKCFYIQTLFFFFQYINLRNIILEEILIFKIEPKYC